MASFDHILAPRTGVVLVRPRSDQNIGLVARAMKNTGFSCLSVVRSDPFDREAYITAVHAEEILDHAGLYSSLEDSLAGYEVVFAAVARHRKNYSSMFFQDALDKMFSLPPKTRIAILFGNERTGLNSDELRRSNFRFSIPQASRQPSYNLAAAVLLTLFGIFSRSVSLLSSPIGEIPLSSGEQNDCIRLIFEKLQEKGFVHSGNRRHMNERIFELFGRLEITAKDRNLLLALFSKGPGEISKS